MKLLLRWVLNGLLMILAVVFIAWAMMAIYYSNLPWHVLRLAVAILFVILAIVSFILIKPFRKAFLCFLLLFAVVLTWWLLIPAKNNRQWQPQSQKVCHADIDGDTITIHNIRNFDYKSIDNFTPAYYDKTFNLSELQTADLHICFWGPTLIAHTMMSFGFGDQGYVCVSIETRKETTEQYSAVKGFFKQYELIYVVGDERDLVRLRTNVEKEDVYTYRLKADPLLIKEVFLDYFNHINYLAENPEWYNALTHNCTTTIRGHTVPYTHRKMDWRFLANGYLDTLLYERGVIETQLPFEQMKAACHINKKALLAGSGHDFSKQIRHDLPGTAEVKLETEQ